MNYLTGITETTMSSREIAECTGKEHFHVKRDIENMMVELKEDVSKSGCIYLDKMNREQTEYLLDRKHTECLLTGYSAKARMRVIERWHELEDKQKPKHPSWVDTLPIEARIAIEAVVAQRNEAVATKAEIGHRREATAMNTASQAIKKANKLEIELDQSRLYCTIKRMKMLTHGEKFSWRELKSAAVEMELPPKEVFDANYGTVKAYHRDVWKEVYALDF